MQNNKIYILVIEDEALIALNLKQILVENGYHIAHIVHDKMGAIDKLSRGGIDLVLLDINLNGRFAGFEIAKMIHEKYKLPYIYITSYSSPEVLNKAKIYQPSGYIVKPFGNNEVAAAIEIAWYNFSKNSQKYPTLTELNEKILNPLSQKEYTILLELVQGRRYKQIAQKQFVSINTINTHIKNIYSKLEVNSKTEALQILLNVM